MQLLAAVVWFVRPTAFKGRTPWMLTPLSSRSLASFVAFTGAFLGWALVDRRFSALQAGLEAVTVGLVTTGIGAVIARSDFNGPAYARTGYVAGLVVLVVLVVSVQVTMRRAAGAA